MLRKLINSYGFGTNRLLSSGVTPRLLLVELSAALERVDLGIKLERMSEFDVKPLGGNSWML